MSLTISNNGAVSAASLNLAKNQTKLQESIKRLSSGKKFTGASGGDAGSVSVAMRLNSSLSRLSGAQSNVGNSISFLEYQDGILETAANIVGRMTELKGLAVSDPLKSTDDLSSYATEFGDLQDQLKELRLSQINGVSVFSNTDGVTFDKGDTASAAFSTITVYTSAKGSEGTSVVIHRSLFKAAMSVDANGDSGVAAGAGDNTDATAGLDLVQGVKVTDLANVTLEQLEGVLDNVIWLRGQTSAGLSKLNFARDSIAVEKINMASALGRIEDADIAEESANLAKYSILMQASAAMVAQANQTSQVALTLLR
jgi:flagellin